MLEFAQHDAFRGIVHRSLWVLGVWILWLTWTSTLPIPSYISVSCIPLLLVYAAISWSIPLAAGIFLVLSWIYAQFSFTPPGYLWGIMFFCLILVKFASMHILLKTPFQFFWAVFAISILFESTQLVIISEIVQLSFWNWQNIGSCLMSSILQGCIGFVLYAPIKKVMV